MYENVNKYANARESVRDRVSKYVNAHENVRDRVYVNVCVRDCENVRDNNTCLDAKHLAFLSVLLL